MRTPYPWWRRLVLLVALLVAPVLAPVLWLLGVGLLWAWRLPRRRAVAALAPLGLYTPLWVHGQAIATDPPSAPALGLAAVLGATNLVAAVLIMGGQGRRAVVVNGCAGARRPGPATRSRADAGRPAGQ